MRSSGVVYRAPLAALLAALLSSFATSASAAPKDDIAKLLAPQFQTLEDDALDAVFTAEPKIYSGGGPTPLKRDEVWGAIDGTVPTSQKVRDRVITLSADKKTAWISFRATVKLDGGEMGKSTVDNHVSQIAVKTAKGWRIAAGQWSQPRELTATKTKPAKLTADGGEITLAAQLGVFAEGTIDKAAKKRKDLVWFGPTPSDYKVGGDAFVKLWAASWANKLKIDSSAASLAPSGNTGWVVANVTAEITPKGKPAMKVPLRLFVVFDKDKEGLWSVVHVHVGNSAG